MLEELSLVVAGVICSGLGLRLFSNEAEVTLAVASSSFWQWESLGHTIVLILQLLPPLLLAAEVHLRRRLLWQLYPALPLFLVTPLWSFVSVIRTTGVTFEPRSASWHFCLTIGTIVLASHSLLLLTLFPVYGFPPLKGVYRNHIGFIVLERSKEASASPADHYSGPSAVDSSVVYKEQRTQIEKEIMTDGESKGDLGDDFSFNQSRLFYVWYPCRVTTVAEHLEVGK